MRILDISSNLNMHITKPTHGLKNSDVVVSDMMHPYSSESIIIPSVPTDIPPGGGQPSDDSVIMCRPKVDRLLKPANEIIVENTRRNDYVKKRSNTIPGKQCVMVTLLREDFRIYQSGV